ncbi:pentapeptide repeat-containing protein [Paraburkholderia caffeinilytica]|uniref:pentapeptide repeat-containing protein n=1 Tax=Paraburkholderia caffeinilytica TaxID=1761016 RepID=UPI0038BB6E2F
MKISILHRWSLRVLFEHDVENNTIALTVRAAVESGADLRSANLRSADLRSANLGGANLRSANLGGADLRSADLRSANLRSANLGGADLRSANLRSADLRSANLGGANLRSANLGGADLRSADLQPIRADFYDVLSHAGKEVPALIDALKNGRVDGSTYTGECSCLVGTIATARGVDVYGDDFGIQTDSNRPAERFFMGISKGDTPETNQVSKIALEWAESWLDMQRKAFLA